MDTYKLNFTRLQSEIFRFLCIKAETSLNQREMAKMLKVSPTAIAKSIKKLEKENLIRIKRSKTMNLTSIELNRNNQKTISLKRIENLRLIYEFELDEFLEEKFPGSTIILFGSYSQGEDTEKSDIDIAVIGSKEKELNLTKFSKLLERPIFIHYYKDFNKIDKNLKSNILNGIVLQGAIEL